MRPSSQPFFVGKYSILKMVNGLLVSFIMVLLLSIQIANATIRYVKPAATGTGLGTDWANASGNLKAMIDSSLSNDEVWVMAGTYKPTKYPTGCTNCDSDRDFAFILKNQVKLYGSFSGSETLLSERTLIVIAANPSILSGDIGTVDDASDNVYHVILSIDDDNTTVFDGFNITKGKSDDGIVNRTIETRNIYRGSGAGMQNRNSSVNVTNCTFSFNLARTGGGINNFISPVVIDNCSFENNSANYAGGGIENEFSTVIINNCSFSENDAGGDGGGGIYNYVSSNGVTNTTFTNNNASFKGGGVGHFGSSSLSVSVYKNCTFIGNMADYGGGIHLSHVESIIMIACKFNSNTAVSGGGVYSLNSSPKILQCAFMENTATENGGAVENVGQDSKDHYVGNCIFVNNSAKFGGAVYNDFNLEVEFVNSTFFSNSASENGGAIYNNSVANVPNNGGTFVRAYLRNCIFSGNKVNESAINPGADLEGNHANTYQFYVAYSILQLTDNNTNYWEATSQGFVRSGFSDGGLANLHAIDALFTNTADLDGSDNILGTTDDGLTLQNNSPAINQGLNAYVTDTSDYLGLTRIQDSIVDMGAYENSFIPSIPPFERRFVKPIASGLGDGSSWINASNNLQAMIDSSGAGNEVWVAGGTYLPANYPTGCTNCSTTREYAFMLKNKVKVYGSFEGTETLITERTASVRNANESILSGDFGTINSYTDNAFHVIISVRDLSNTVLDGFKITRGYNYSGNELKIENHTIENTGGGMINVTSSPTIRNCIFTLNRASTDGGMTNTRYSNPVIDSCTFSGNIANSTGGMGNSYGSSPTISNCTFLNNSCTYYGGAMRNYSSSFPIISHTTFNNNGTYYAGGAIFNNTKSAATIDHCVFILNSVQYDNGGAISLEGGLLIVSNSIFAGNRSVQWKGGAISNWDSTLVINCVFRDNGAGTDGGGIYSNGTLQVFNSTFYANYASTGGGINNAAGSGIMANNIFWQNRTGGSITAVGSDIRTDQGSAETYATYSSLQLANTPTNYPNNGAGKGFIGSGEGNVFEINPLFLDVLDTNGPDDIYHTSDDGYTLQNCSPLKNIGGNLGIPVETSTDIIGVSRIFNTIVDMGAYENQSGEMTVAINSDPINASICPGYNISFTAVPTNVGANPTYNFLINGSSIQDNSNPIFSSMALANNDVIKAVLTSGACIDTSNLITVTHYALPIPSLSSNSPICTNEALNLNASGGSSYSWTGPNTFSSGLQNPTLSNASFLASGIYTATVTDANSCTATSSILVAVNQVAPNISANPAIINFGQNTTLSATGCNGLIQWSFAGLTDNPLVITLDNSNNFTATCTVGACTSFPSEITFVTVNGNPCQNQVTLVSTTDDYPSGIYKKIASSTTGKITASNKLTGSSKVVYNGKSIELEPGFKAEIGTLFLAETGRCD